MVTSVDTKEFMRYGLEAIVGYLKESDSDPYVAVSKKIEEQYNFKPGAFMQLHHPFHWYLVLEKKLIVMELNQKSGQTIYKLIKTPNKEEIGQLADELYAEHGTMIEARFKNLELLAEQIPKKSDSV
jgi:hypothetical protein